MKFLFSSPLNSVCRRCIILQCFIKKRERIEKHSKSGNGLFHSLRKLVHQNHSPLNNYQKIFPETFTYWLTHIDICDEVFKTGLSKFCRRQPLKHLKGYGLLNPLSAFVALIQKPVDCTANRLTGFYMRGTLTLIGLSAAYPFKSFKGCLPQNLPSPLLNTLSHMYVATCCSKVNIK